MENCGCKGYHYELCTCEEGGVKPPAASSGYRHKAEAKKHDEVTREILIGILVDSGGALHTRTSRKIMAMLKRRGYEPQILSCNQLKDGRHI